MSSHQSGRHAAQGPTWKDVQEWMEEAMRTYGGCVYWEVTVAPGWRQMPSYKLWCRCVWKDVGRDKQGAEIACGDFWPTARHKTMPGLIARLIFELERKLVDRAVDRALEERPFEKPALPPRLTSLQRKKGEQGY